METKAFPPAASEVDSDEPDDEPMGNEDALEDELRSAMQALSKVAAPRSHARRAVLRLLPCE